MQTKQHNCTHDVIFRKWPQPKYKYGGIIALFPGIPGSSDSQTCLSYQHIGQHSAASVFISNRTQPATPGEYHSLLDELAKIGYRKLRIISRFTSAHHRQRLQQLAPWTTIKDTL